MRPTLLLALLLLLGACAPAARQDHTLFVTREGSLTHQTLQAPFYRTLLDLGVSIRDYEAHSYHGQDGGVPSVLTAALTDNEGLAPHERYCAFRGNTFRSPDGAKVLVLAANDRLGVRGVIYDASRAPRLTYTVFTGTSYRPLLPRRCA
jgi:hypothetical protein